MGFRHKSLFQPIPIPIYFIKLSTFSNFQLCFITRLLILSVLDLDLTLFMFWRARLLRHINYQVIIYPVMRWLPPNVFELFKASNILVLVKFQKIIKSSCYCPAGIFYRPDTHNKISAVWIRTQRQVSSSKTQVKLSQIRLEKGENQCVFIIS